MNNNLKLGDLIYTFNGEEKEIPIMCELEGNIMEFESMFLTCLNHKIPMEAVISKEAFDSMVNECLN